MQQLYFIQDNSAKFGKLKEATSKLAISYLNDSGLSPKEAARKAYEDVIGDRFKFIKGNKTPMIGGRVKNNVLLMIPKDVDSDIFVNKYGLENFILCVANKLYNIKVTLGRVKGLHEYLESPATILNGSMWVSESNGGVGLYYNGVKILDKRGNHIRLTQKQVLDFDEGAYAK